MAEAAVIIDNTQEDIIHEDNHDKIPLEPDKFHLFFSYSSQDEELILPTLHILESAPYNLECCVDRRDFMLGETTAKNINRALSNSLGTVFFLTPNFLESAYCQHEIQTAFTMYMEGECKVIPVILKPCSVPDEFRTIHYIDEAFPEKIAERIYKCLKTDPKDFKNQLPLNPIHAGQRRLNGNRFTLNTAHNLEYINQGTDVQGDFITHYQKREFERLGIQVDAILAALLKMVVYIPITKPCYRYHLKKFFFLSSLVRSFVLSNAFVLIYTIANLHGGDMSYLRILFILGNILLASQFWGMFLIPYAVVDRSCDISRSHSILVETNKLSVLDKDVCFGLKAPLCGSAVVTIVKYDIKDCKSYLENEYEQLDVYRGTDFKLVWDKVIKTRVFSQYFKKLCDETLPHVNEERHRVINEKLCFCQYFEMHSGGFPPIKPQESSTNIEIIDDNDTVGLVNQDSNNVVV